LFLDFHRSFFQTEFGFVSRWHFSNSMPSVNQLQYNRSAFMKPGKSEAGVDIMAKSAIIMSW
jgi:hypothetical protein